MSKSKMELRKIKNFIDIDAEDSELILERKAFVSDLKIDETEEKTAIFKMSCGMTDDDGDYIVPEGCNLSRYQKNAPLLWAHEWSSLPIGVAKEVVVSKEGVYSKNKFGDTQFANDVWGLVKLGAIRCCSVGFVVKKSIDKGTREFGQYVTEKGLKIGNNTQRIVTEWKLYENSLVNIPSNEDAIVQAISTKSLELNKDTIKKLGIEIKDAEQPVVEPEEVIVEPVIEPIVEPIVEKAAEVPVIVVEPAPVVVPAPVVEPVVEPVVVPVVVPVVEPVKAVEEPVKVVEAPVVEAPKRTWTVIREGDYKPTSVDKRIAKEIKKGKIL